MKKDFLLIVLILFIGCESNHKQTAQAPSKPVPSRPAVKGVSFAGGDGSSVENAVIIKAPTELAGVLAEYDWIKKNRPDWQFKTQSIKKAGAKVYDKMDFLTPDGRSETLYFDVTDFFGKL